MPNKFPALTSPAEQVDTIGNPFTQTSALGLHEVVIDTPDHETPLGRLRLAHLEELLTVYQARLRRLAQEPGIQSILVFRNEGRAAGASQEHPHSQILALPIVPPRLLAELDEARRHFAGRGACLTCDTLERELEDGRRLVLQNDLFAAVTSFAPRFPYELSIVPKVHAHDFSTMGRPGIVALASILKRVLGAMESAIGPFPFNLVLQTAPVAGAGRWSSAFHWRIEILPRLTVPSGFELGCGVSIVALSPEAAAMALRPPDA